MDVAAWMRDLGLERYVSAFRDNDIDQSTSTANHYPLSAKGAIPVRS